LQRITRQSRSRAIRPGLRGALCCACLLFALVAVAAPPPALQGRPLQEVLDEQRAAGLPLVYSTGLVGPDLRVLREPVHREPLLLVDEILAPHGLALQPAEGIYLVVPRDPAAPSERPPPAADGRAEAGDPAAPLELERLSVSASRYLLSANSRFFIDQRAIEALPDLGEDPLRSAQRLPGTAAGGLSARSHFRGGEHNETAIYLNGLELLDPFHIRDYHSIFSTIDAQAIAGVEAYTGGFPATWGDRTSGVMLLETRAADEPLTTQLGLSVYNTSVLNSGHTAGEGVQWLVSARRSNLDAVLSDDLGQPDYFDVFGELGLQLAERHRLSLNALYADDQVVVITENDPAELEQSVSDTRNEHLWLSWTGEWTPDLSSETVLSRASLDNRRNAEVNDPERMLAAVDDWREAEILGLQLELRYAGFDRHRLRAGIGLRRERARYRYRSRAAYSGFYEFYPGIVNPTASRIEADPAGNGYALFLSDRWGVTESTGVELGLRRDRQTWTEPEYGAQLSPRLSLLHRLPAGTELRLTWGRYYQPQGIQELQVEDGLERFFAPQRADHWIAGVRHRFGNSYRLRVEAWLKDYARLRPRFENLFDPLALIPELAPDRVRLDPASASARGIELTLEYRGDGDVEWWAFYSWSRASDTIDGASQPRSWDQRHAAQAGLAWRPGPWEIGLALSVHSGWPTTALGYETVDDGEEEIFIPVPGPRNAGRFATFAQLDLRVAREFAVRRGRLSAFFELSNATNRDNPCCVDYDIDEDPAGEPFLDRTVDYWLPLLPAVGILWEF
jgi:outer membrane receptor protein involved in Fe transport